MTAPDRRKARRTRRRRARVAAVQALYRVGLTGDDVEAAVADLSAPNADAPRMDTALFGTLARGAAERRPAVDPAISAALAEGWRIERLSETMRALLRVAAFELSHGGDVPPTVVINEYVDIAAGFFDPPEIGFVNGVVDRLARDLGGAPGATGAGDTGAGSADG